MTLIDVGMVAGDTSRSRLYLQALAQRGLLPNFVLLMENITKTVLPGQVGYKKVAKTPEKEINIDNCVDEKLFDLSVPLKTLLEKHDVKFDTIKSHNVNDVEVIDVLSTRSESVFIYSGFGGTILRKEVLSINKKFLHVHGGFLPSYKGSTTNYYSLINENFIGASAIFLSEKIDSGPILYRKKYPAPENKEEIDHVYDSVVRAKVLIETLMKYADVGNWSFECSKNEGGQTYYIIHPVLKHISILAKQ